MDPVKPSQELLRSLTDEHVLRALMRHRRLTRAELSTETGISKPTAGESVRRLTEAGLVVDTGRRTPGGRGRGRVGSYYALAPDVGTALAVSIAPEGVVAECVDAYGDVRARAEQEIGRPARPAEVATALATAVERLRLDARPRIAVVSAADPVDRHSGRLRQLPDAPFLLGEIDPVAVLADRVDGPVLVDNDVNWAAEAERESTPLDDFAYVYLDEGLGCAIVSDGEVRRGHHGLAGEVAHLITVGPRGRAMPLIEVFGVLGLRQANSTAIDVDLLLEKRPPEVVTAVGGLVAALATLIDPELVIVGGRWGTALIEDVAGEIAGQPRPVSVRAAAVENEPSLAGARADALHRLRELIVSR